MRRWKRSRRRLREQNLTVFLDRWYLTPGQSWPKALEATLAQCRAVAVCIGQGEMGPWQQREQYLALERQVAAERRGESFPVIPVLLPGAEPPLGFLSQNTWVDFRTRVDDPVLLTTLVRAIQVSHQARMRKTRSVKPSPPSAPTGACCISARKTPHSFLAVQRPLHNSFAPLSSTVSSPSLGPRAAGSPRSCRAGLVPALRKSRERVWEVATIVPTDRPLHALAAVLMPLLDPDMSETDRLIETNKLADALLATDRSSSAMWRTVRS